MLIRFSKLSSTAIQPKFATPGASGMDLHADIETWIAAGFSKLIPTNIAMMIPIGYEGQVRPRSGLALKKRITVLNTPGTIDSDYRGGIGVILHNTGDEPFLVKQGDRIAQLVIAPVVPANVVNLVEFDELAATDRGAGGFGSTGVSEAPLRQGGGLLNGKL